MGSFLRSHRTAFAKSLSTRRTTAAVAVSAAAAALALEGLAADPSERFELVLLRKLACAAALEGAPEPASVSRLPRGRQGAAESSRVHQ